MRSDWLPRTSIPEFEFPAIPDRQGALALSIQFQLSQSQWWSPDRLLGLQLKQLTSLVHHAKSSTRHYRDIDIPIGSELTLETFRSLPLLRRRDIQTAGDGLFSARPPQSHGSSITVMTSGSTGTPVTVLKSELAMLLWQAFTLRESLWHKRDLSAHLGIIKYIANTEVCRPPDGTVLPGWGPATDEIFPSAPATMLNVGTPIDEQAAWLRKVNPTYLLTHPSNLRALAEYFEAKSLPPPDALVQLRTSGELLTPETRDFCEKFFGVPIADMYSSQEIGYMALQCPESTNYHVQAENVLLEVLDSAGNACGPGETGRVVVTDLHNYASPLLRYEIGDYAEVASHCQCGRGLPALRRIIGRERNMWVRPDGRRAWPLITSKKMRAAAPYRQLQLEQQRIDLIVVRLVPEGHFGADHKQALTAAIHECLGFKTNLEFEIVDSIQRGRNGKFEEFICRI